MLIFNCVGFQLGFSWADPLAVLSTGAQIDTSTLNIQFQPYKANMVMRIELLPGVCGSSFDLSVHCCVGVMVLMTDRQTDRHTERQNETNGGWVQKYVLAVRM